MNKREISALRDWILLVGAVLVVMWTVAMCSPVYPAESGIASITATPGRTASGEKFNPRSLTAAHRRLPFGSLVRVTRGKLSVTVRINDRGPFRKGRIIDLTPAAAQAIGMSFRMGLAKVTVEPATKVSTLSCKVDHKFLASRPELPKPASLVLSPPISRGVRASVEELADFNTRVLEFRPIPRATVFRVGKRRLATTRRSLTGKEAAPAPFQPGDLDKIVELDEARRYLVETATVGGTMARQGADLAIWRLNPTFTVRLAKAIREARAQGISASVFSAYRPPAFGVGGFSDKFNSMHAYGLAVDMAGVGRPGSSISLAWFKIAGRNKIYNPYGPHHRAEWNHYQPTFAMAVARGMALRGTITATGPREPEKMWRVAEAIISHKVVTELPRARVKKKKWRRRWYGHRQRVAAR